MAAERPASRRLPIGLMVLGSEMASFTIVGLLLDYALGTMPFLTIALTVLGFVAAFVQLLQIAKKLKQPPTSKPGPP